MILKVAAMPDRPACSLPGGCGGGRSLTTRRRLAPPSDAGIELRVPTAWIVTIDVSTRRIEASGGGVKAVIWPMFAKAPNGVSDRAVARHLAKRLWPRARWQESGDSVALRGEEDGRLLAAMAASSPSPSGTAIVFYGIDAPPGQFDATARDAVTVFTSVRVTQPADPAAPPKPKLTFARWRDPREGAFSVEVPDGWKVVGGTFRYAAVALTRGRAIAGCSVMVRIGDLTPTFTEPLPFFPEGSTYSRMASTSAFGVPCLGERSPPITSATVAQWCGGTNVVDGRDRGVPCSN
jgi:hypothetical protein